MDTWDCKITVNELFSVIFVLVRRALRNAIEKNTNVGVRSMFHGAHVPRFSEIGGILILSYELLMGL